MYSRASGGVLCFCGLLVLTLSIPAKEVRRDETRQVLVSTASSSTPAVLPVATATIEEEQDLDYCYTFPCLHKGTCIDGINSYTCVCPHNFNGTHCENDLAAMYGCGIQPCLNQGVCLDQPDSKNSKFTCVCNPAFTGVYCEIRRDLCLSNPCEQGTCSSDGVVYWCNCTDTGFTGVNCNEDINECENTTICGGYRCSNRPDGFSCTCPPGFDGVSCKEINECTSSPCQNGATCTDGFNTFTCACLPGFIGRVCEVDIDECTSQPCQNGGICEDRINAFTCACLPGFTGRMCEVDIDECTSQPCQNGGICEDRINTFTCTCLPGFTGRTCEVDIDECTSQPCQNGGICEDRINAFTCTCPPGYRGAVCEQDIDECSGNPCVFNTMACRDKVNGFECLCREGFSGPNCGVNIDDCSGLPCQNGGECFDGINDYTCNCTSQWMGKNCTEVYNACSVTPCLNGATCSTDPPQHDYKCACLPGFAGHNCQVNIDDCVGHTCPNYQLCYDGIGNYSCRCPRGYTGARCDSKMLTCDDHPCQNNGTCEPHGEGYKCICQNEYINVTSILGPKGIFLTGFAGTNCEFDIDECAHTDPPICQQGGKCEDSPPGGFTCFCKNSPGHLSYGRLCQDTGDYCDVRLTWQECQNGGKCVNLFVGFRCECAPGFSGRYCEINIDECLSQPCLYNGTCSDRIDGYACTCPEGFSGANCETNIDECSPNPCHNGGICQDHFNNFTCDCTNTGFQGTTCEVDTDVCVPGRCQHGGVCVDRLKDTHCTCLPGYSGARCEVDIQDCIPNPCANNSRCLEYSNTSLYDKGNPHFVNFTYEKAAGYHCLCLAGIQGVNCTEDIDECLSGPCQNNATCVNFDKGGFTCNCTRGYEGALCEAEVSECNLYTPCKNGGICTDKVTDYVCTCPEPRANRVNYGGRNCTTLLAGCIGPLRCPHGDCIPHLYSEAEDIHIFSCDCFPGFAGKYCTESTTVSFNSSGVNYMLIPVAGAYFTLSLRFRTSVPKGVLVLWKFSNTSFVSVELNDGKILMQYKDTSGYEVCTLNTRSPVNNSEYHQLNMNVAQKIHLSLPYDNCTDDACSTQGCQTSFTFRESQPHNGTQIYIGRQSGVTVDDPGMPSGFVGCVEDVVVAGIRYYPGLRSEQYYVGSGCPRVPQCVQDSCSGHGVCEDLWDSYTCHCDRPYYGKNCENA